MLKHPQGKITKFSPNKAKEHTKGQEESGIHQRQ